MADYMLDEFLQERTWLLDIYSSWRHGRDPDELSAFGPKS
jgi:hypothetical protein